MKLDETFIKVVPNLFVSNWQTANSEKFYMENGVKARLTVMNDNCPFYDGELLEHRLLISAPDGPGFEVEHVAKAVEFLEKTHGELELSVLVHGVSGWSRSVACVIAYLRKNNLTAAKWDESLASGIRRYLQCEKGFLPDANVWERMKEYLASVG